MLLDVSRALRAQGEEFHFAVQEELPDQEFMGDIVSFPAPAELSGFFSSTEGGIMVRGTLRVTAQAPCARCLEPVQTAFAIPVEEVYKRLEADQAPGQNEEFADSLYFTGHQLDFAGLIMTLALLHLPMRFLCEPECPEIGSDASVPEPHPACGSDKGNNEPDDHADRPGNYPFAGLDKLLKMDEEV